MYLPWRKEEVDLLGGFENYTQHYRAKYNIISAKQQEYEHHVEELEQAQHAAEQDLAEEFDELAPSTEQVQAEDYEEGTTPSKEFIHFDPNKESHKEYDIGPDIGLPQKTTAVEHSATRISEEDYCTLLQSLNEKQRKFHDHVIHWMRTKDDPLYAFLTGGAGVGKSVLINAVYQSLQRLLCSKEGENPDEIRILLCAYTGKAAYNINGMTIASAFHKKMYQSQQHMHADELNTYRTKYRTLKVVIIDEISMVGNKHLAFIHQRLTELTTSAQDFGGISIIAVGDLYQLCPIGESWIFKDLTAPGQFLAKNLWKENFKMFELEEIMRQRNDKMFAELLNRLRHNNLTEEDRALIASRIISVDHPDYPFSAPHLFIENKFVNKFNEDLMQKLQTAKVTVEADTDVISEVRLKPEQKIKLLKLLPDNPANTGQLSNSLTLAVNMMYDVSVNIDVLDGLTNGASCVVKSIECKETTSRPAIVWVLFNDRKIGMKRRNQYHHLLGNNIETNYTPIFETKRTFVYNRKTFERIQFPLQPSAAKTVHKAQGSTVDEVVIDLSQSRPRKCPHIHYVALSRSRYLENLHILNFNENSLTKDESVEEEMQRLRENSSLQLCFTPPADLPHNFKIMFNNARSLNKHFKDLQCDPYVYSVDIIGIGESRLIDTDKNEYFQLNNFTMIRNDAQRPDNGGRPSHGLVVYLKDTLDIVDVSLFSTVKVEFVVIKAVKLGALVQCVFLYKQPKCSSTHFMKILKEKVKPLVNLEKHLFIVGDFNIDVSKGENKTILSFMRKEFSCFQVILEPTTKFGSTIDLIFSNNTTTIGSVLFSYWSDHNSVFCASDV